MTRIYDFTPPDDRGAEASGWIAKLDRGLSAGEAEALKAWMAKHPDNQAALLELAGLWDRMDVLSRLDDLFQRPARSGIAGLRFKAAAAIVGAGLVGWLAVMSLDFPEQAPEQKQAGLTAPERLFETAIGEQSTVNLTDGSQVILNTNSLVRVKYTQQHRLVTLERGEIHVRVADDKSRPLSVIAGENIIQAVGTEFNIEISDDRKIELVVTEGRVLVGVHRPPEAAAEESEPAVLPLSSVTVGAGEELILGSDDEQVTEVSPVELEVKLSWQSGNLVFRGESLEDAVEEIGRYTSVEFVILDDDLRKVRIAGLFKAGDVDGLLAALRENFDIAYQRTDERIVLLSSK